MKMYEMLPEDIKARKLEIEGWYKKYAEKFDCDFGFGFLKRKKIFGNCSYANSKIHISEKYLDRPNDDIKRTLLHEIAHYKVREEFNRKAALACEDESLFKPKLPRSHGKEFKIWFDFLTDVEGLGMEHTNYIARDLPKHHVIVNGVSVARSYKGISKRSKAYYLKNGVTFINEQGNSEFVDGDKVEILTHLQYLKKYLKK